MGYSLRRESSSVNLVEEKKEDGGGSDSELCLGDRGVEKKHHEHQQQQLSSDVTDENNIITAQVLSTNNNIAAPNVVVANEPLAMQQDPIVDDQHSQVNQLHTLSLAAQVASCQQQTQLMTSSLNSLQLNNVHQHQQQQTSDAGVVLPSSASVLGSNSFNTTPGVVSTNVIPHAVQPQTVAHIQQQVLAQQQAAAHAAALSIGAVTSSQTQLATTPVIHHPGATATSGFVQGGVPSSNIISPLLVQANNNFLHNSQKQQQQQEQHSLGVGGTLGMSTAGSMSNPNPLAAAMNAPSIIPSTVSLAANNAIVSPSSTHHHHQLSPLLTIPHYVPPIPATWGAQLPTLSVQDRPLVPPIYNGINPNYPGAQLLHAHPPIFIVDNFLNGAECDFLIDAASDAFGPAPVVGKGSGEVSPSRTSSTCYLAREDLPEYLRKVSLLTGKPAEHCELPQVGRYYPNQQYLQHFDAFDLSNDDGRRFAANGGQRTVTVLVYLNDVPRGGATRFPSLNIEVQPRRGMALVFFPSTLDGLLDKMCLHAALPAVDVKYVSQVWIRQSNYEGTPSKRLSEPMSAGLQERRDAAHKLLLQQQIHQQAAAVAHHQQQIVAQQLQQQHHQAAQLLQQQHNHLQQQQQNQGYQQMNG